MGKKGWTWTTKSQIKGDAWGKKHISKRYFLKRRNARQCEETQVKGEWRWKGSNGHVKSKSKGLKPRWGEDAHPAVWRNLHLQHRLWTYRETHRLGPQRSRWGAGTLVASGSYCARWWNTEAGRAQGPTQNTCMTNKRGEESYITTNLDFDSVWCLTCS